MLILLYIKKFKDIKMNNKIEKRDQNLKENINTIASLFKAKSVHCKSKNIKKKNNTHTYNNIYYNIIIV